MILPIIRSYVFCHTSSASCFSGAFHVIDIIDNVLERKHVPVKYEFHKILTRVHFSIPNATVIHFPINHKYFRDAC
jgi:hypothetical protein